MMEAKQKNTEFTVLMAEDDPDDRLLIEQALLEIGNDADLRFVEDGEELMSDLRIFLSLLYRGHPCPPP
jgi:CheY-like chemotaxis protein